MSLHENFAQASRPGFIHSVDPRAARRQFHLSLGVVAVLAAAISGSAMTIRPASGFDVASQRAQNASFSATSDHHANAWLRVITSKGG